MLELESLNGGKIVVVRPHGSLSAGDFERLAGAVDPLIEEAGTLSGLMIESESFPGWKDFAALISHLRFVRDHHRSIRRVAAVTDSAFLEVMPRISGHFVAAEVRHFDYAEKETALAWLSAGESNSTE